MSIGRPSFIWKRLPTYRNWRFFDRRNVTFKKNIARRKAATRSLVDVIAIALAAFTAQECLNFFATAGYDHA
jgi:hypothetical protein